MNINLDKKQWEEIGREAGWIVAQKDNLSDVEFIKARQSGAKKIAKSAKEKGGPSILTMWHFEAKEGPYNAVLEAIENDEPIAHYQEKCNKLIKRINFEEMTKKSFQEIMGELEVWGEAIGQIF